MAADSVPPQGILSDQPASEDRLNFAPYAKTLADIIADHSSATPLTIGVFGSWGQGKTSLMRMVEKMVSPPPGESSPIGLPDPAFPIQTVWFNAWLYSQQQSLWRALISRVLNAVHQFKTLDQKARENLRNLEARLYSMPSTGSQMVLPTGTLAELSGASLPPLMGLELLRRQAEHDGDDEKSVRLTSLIGDMAFSEARQISALDDFRREFEDISKKHIVANGRLAVFVDDLDRCLPDKAVEVLEAIKLFLDVPGCIFVLGIAREVIEQGIRVRYMGYKTDLSGAEYLEKIIQIPFSLPPIDGKAVRGYVHQIAGANLPDARCGTVFSVGLEPNPRRIKRTLNIFLLLWRLAQNRPDLQQNIKAVRLAKIVIIQQYHPRLFELITGRPYLLIDLEQRLRSLTKETSEALERAGRGTGTGEADISAGPLQDFLTNSLLRALLTCTPATDAEANFIDLNAAQVRDYIYLTHSSVEETAPTAAEAEASPFEPQMVAIPAGKFLMGASDSELKEIAKLDKNKNYQEAIKREIPQHEVTLPAYAIGRYPVTNAEFKRFIDDGGYKTQDYWTEVGWKQKESENWTKPRYWDDAQWNDPAQPVVDVSWYEAYAYCQWLARKSGKPYRLPTEAEWEYAARGKEGSRYPWGNQWDKARCNNTENRSDRTTPVGQFSPQGDSSFGVGDLVGQVWEWCSTKYGGTDAQPKFKYPYDAGDGREDLTGDDTRIFRGGSWSHDPAAAYCRCGYRYWSDPWLGNLSRGFRCARIK
jgi:formylglycine-generating enzyme required for sulfatase activity